MPQPSFQATVPQEGFKRHIEKKEDFQIGFGGKLIRICLLSLLSSLKVELFCIKSWFTIFWVHLFTSFFFLASAKDDCPGWGPLISAFYLWNCKLMKLDQKCNPAFYAKRSSLKEEGSFNARKTLFFYSLKFLYLLLNIAWVITSLSMKV